MMQKAKMRRGLALRLYLLASHGLPLIAGTILRRRLKRGKEAPQRWREKLGQSLAARPDGQLIWLHAVGLGEVMSLRGLITRLHAQDPDLSFLVTSTTATSAEVFSQNLPMHTIHQFLPIDAPTYRRRFLDHFRPDLAVWVEQDIWPGFVSDANAQGIPQAVIAARMNERSHASHKKVGGLYRDIYQAMNLVTAQDQDTAKHLTRLGALEVKVTGSLKPSAPPLAHDPAELAQLQNTLSGRRIWAVAPSHPEDEAVALAAHAILQQSDPTALLIIAPRYPRRRDEIVDACDIPPKIRSKGEVPSPEDPVWLCDTFGELGLVYRLADTVLIGGTFSEIEGHNPWEAAALDAAILHGPRLANFRADFANLDEAEAAFPVADSTALATALQATDALTENARKVVATAATRTDALASTLISLLRT